MKDSKIFKSFLEDFYSTTSENRKRVLEVGLSQILDKGILSELDNDISIFSRFIESDVSLSLKHKFFNTFFSFSNFLTFKNILNYFSEKYSLPSDFFVEGKFVKFNFPVYNFKEGTGFFVNASVFVYEKPFNGIDLFGCLSENKLATISTLTKKGFLFSADSLVSFNSYMLSTYLAVSLGFFPEKFTFTGGLTNEGEILPVEYLNEKKQKVKECGKTLVDNGVFDNNAIILRDFFNGEIPLKIPFFASVTGDDKSQVKNDFEFLKQSVNSGNQINNFFLEKFVEQTDSFLGFPHLPDKEESDYIFWVENAKKTRDYMKETFQKILQNMDGNFAQLPEVNFVLGLKGPVAFGYCLGFFLRNNVKNISHFAQLDNQKYFLVRNSLNVDNKSLLEFRCEGEGDNKLFAINLISDSYKIIFDKLCVKDKLTKCEIVLKKEKKKLNVEDFPYYAKEIIDILRDNASFNSSLILAMPVSIALLIGYNSGRVAFDIYHQSKNKNDGYLKIPAKSFK